MEEVMDIIQELEYYCEEKHTLGALLLTGDWGSGKTYLINNQFKNSLGEKFIFIKVSLFGVSDINAVNKMIKKEYVKQVAMNMDTFLESNPNSAIAKILGSINSIKFTPNKASRFFSSILKKVPYLKEVYAFEYEDLIDVENKIGNKPIILIFDDLERCTIETREILGLMNDYCENLEIKTIILANEDKIGDSNNNDTVNYSEIKEKLISRTLFYKPNYKEILREIIEKYSDKSDGTYKSYLISENVYVNLYDIFIMSEHNNLRSFKCIIQDFERVYSVLINTKLKKYLNEILFSFAVYLLESKIGNPTSDSIYTINDNLKKYGSYGNTRYDFNSLKQWIDNGVWDEHTFRQEIAENVKAFSPQTALDRIRCNGRLMELDESDIDEAYDSFLELAYNGELSLNEYVLLIMHYIFAKRMEYSMPSLDFDSLKNGIEKQKRTLVCNLHMPNTHRNVIDDDSFNGCEELKEAYYLIKNFQEKDGQLFEINKKKYLEALKNNNMYEMESKKLKEFDYEIAQEVFKSFSSISNVSKVIFIRSFTNTWRLSSDKNVETSIPNFQYLKEELKKRKSAIGKNKIESYNIDCFIKAIDEIIQEYPNCFPSS